MKKMNNKTNRLSEELIAGECDSCGCNILYGEDCFIKSYGVVRLQKLKDDGSEQELIGTQDEILLCIQCHEEKGCGTIENFLEMRKDVHIIDIEDFVTEEDRGSSKKMEETCDRFAIVYVGESKEFWIKTWKVYAIDGDCIAPAMTINYITYTNDFTIDIEFKEGWDANILIRLCKELESILKSNGEITLNPNNIKNEP